MARIALISEHASPLALTGGTDSGGQNIYVAHVATQLARQGWTVDVFSRRDDGVQPAVSAELQAVDSKPARRRLGWERDVFTVLQLGRIVPRKRIDNVIAAMAHLKYVHGIDARLKSHFTWSRVARQLDGIYRRLSPQARRRDLRERVRCISGNELLGTVGLDGNVPVSLSAMGGSR